MFIRHEAGAYRQPYGSDIIGFYGSTADDPEDRPRLELTLQTTDPDSVPDTAPFRDAPYPTSPTGSLLSRTQNSLEISCDGGELRLRVNSNVDPGNDRCLL